MSDPILFPRAGWLAPQGGWWSWFRVKPRTIRAFVRRVTKKQRAADEAPF